MRGQRIDSIDAVRAMALLGILLVHAHAFFNIRCPEPVPIGMWDAFFHRLTVGALESRAFMVFSFLFGLSFFLQMDHAAARREPFTARFCWRLVLLGAFGVLHSFFYCGDILIIFAIAGFALVPLWRASGWLVSCLAALLLLQPLALYHTLSGAPDAMQQWMHAAWQTLGIAPTPNHMTASFWEIGAWNVRDGELCSLIYTIYTYRIWDILAMFMLGLLAGRMRLFEGGSLRPALAALGSALVWAAVSAPSVEATFGAAAVTWQKAASVGVFAPTAAWLAARPCLARCVWPLTRVGRCTLTCYIMQSVVMAAALSGYGWGLRSSMSLTGVMLLALGLYGVQLLFCVAWLSYFRYGPLEGIWRRLTRIGMG